jgi:hypothetical protein
MVRKYFAPELGDGVSKLYLDKVLLIVKEKAGNMISLISTVGRTLKVLNSIYI